MANTLLGKINDALKAMSDDMEGTAVAGDVLAPKTFYNTSVDEAVTGTMSNKTGTTASASNASMGDETTLLNVVPPEGYYDGETAAVSVDLAAVDLEMEGTAVADDVLETKTFYNTSLDEAVTGTMSNKTGTTASASNASMGHETTLNVVPPAGYYDGETAAVSVDLAAVDANLSAGNIKSGVVVLGITGTYDGE